MPNDEFEHAYRLARHDLRRAVKQKLQDMGQQPFESDDADREIARNAATLREIDPTDRVIHELLGQKTNITALFGGVEGETLMRAMKRLADLVNPQFTALDRALAEATEAAKLEVIAIRRVGFGREAGDEESAARVEGVRDIGNAYTLPELVKETGGQLTEGEIATILNTARGAIAERYEIAVVTEALDRIQAQLRGGGDPFGI